jgi:hypothetical protein
VRTLLVVSSNPDGPGVRHRWRAYAPHLARAGVALEVAAWGDDFASRSDAVRRAASAAGAVIASRLLSGPGLRALRRRARRLAFDFDDALPFHDTAGGATRSRTRARRFRAAVRRADRVFAGNLYLAGLAAQEGAVADVLPTTVEVPDGPVLPEPDGPPTLGWIGSRATLPYLEGMGGVLAALAAAGRRVRVRAIADAAPRMPASVEVDAVPWTEDGWAAALAATHVGVAPLPDDRWTRGKCGLKVLQSMSLGRPVVASDVGMQGQAVRDGETGVLVRSPEAMRDGIARLLDDAPLRRRLGEAAREEVRRRWSVAAWAPRVVAAVEGWLA